MARTKPNDTQIAFRNLATRDDLARFLGVDPGLLRFLLYGRKKDNYSSITIAKRGGGEREIRSPIRPLKDVQRALAKKLVEIYSPRSCVMGYVRGSSILRNAKKHKGKCWVLRVDLTDFFGTINFGRLRGLFLSLGLAENVATCASQICCDDNKLPQGAPTSPVLSNMLCMRLDRQLSKISRQNGVDYTRYVDDLIFSTHKKKFPASHYNHGEDELGSKLEGLISGNGFEINRSKTKLSDRLSRQMVTGLIVNETEGVPREKVRELRQQIYYSNKFGPDSVAERFFAEKDRRNRLPGASPDFLSILRGKLEFVRFVRGETDRVYGGLASEFVKLDSSFPVPQATYPRIQLFFEGESEEVYFRTAFSALSTSLGLRLNPKFSYRVGDSALLSFLRIAGDIHPRDLTICVFDHDDDSIIRQVRDEHGAPRKWGENLFSTTIAKPDFRSQDEYICAEYLFPDSCILQWHDGFRMFFNEEFNQDGICIGHSQYKRQGRKGGLIPSRVVDSGGDNVLFQKTKLALSIEHRAGPFRTMDFSGFSPTYQEIMSLVDQHV